MQLFEEVPILLALFVCGLAGWYFQRVVQSLVSAKALRAKTVEKSKNVDDVDSVSFIPSNSNDEDAADTTKSGSFLPVSKKRSNAGARRRARRQARAQDKDSDHAVPDNLANGEIISNAVPTYIVKDQEVETFELDKLSVVANSPEDVDAVPNTDERFNERAEALVREDEKFRGGRRRKRRQGLAGGTSNAAEQCRTHKAHSDVDACGVAKVHEEMAGDVDVSVVAKIDEDDAFAATGNRAVEIHEDPCIGEVQIDLKSSTIGELQDVLERSATASTAEDVGSDATELHDAGESDTSELDDTAAPNILDCGLHADQLNWHQSSKDLWMTSFGELQPPSATAELTHNESLLRNSSYSDGSTRFDPLPNRNGLFTDGKTVYALVCVKNNPLNYDCNPSAMHDEFLEKEDWNICWDFVAQC